jgi:hypothetical protein
MHGHTGGHVGGHIPPPHHQPHQAPHTPAHNHDIWNAGLAEPLHRSPRRNVFAALIHNPRAASTLLVLTIALVLILIFAV